MSPSPGAAAHGAGCPKKPVLRAFAALSALALSAGAAHASCGAAFCSLETDWGSEAAGLGEGSSLEVRYEHIVQDQPRAGWRKVRVGEVPRHHDEVRTRNRNLITTYRHSWASGWGIAVTAPLADRDHLHIHHHRGEQIQERWDFRELGDVRVTGRYQRTLSSGEQPARSGALVFGLKLPTGKHDVANAGGDGAERSLQPGTGTTDLVLGGVLHQQLAAGAGSLFAQVQAQLPLNARDDYRPGAQFNIDLGYGRPLAERVEGVIQLNTVVKRRDRGAAAEPADTGGRFLFLSPGLSFAVTDALRVYAFYQHPVHQHVNGVQLTAKRAAVVGVTTRF